MVSRESDVKKRNDHAGLVNSSSQSVQSHISSVQEYSYSWYPHFFNKWSSRCTVSSNTAFSCLHRAIIIIFSVVSRLLH